MVTACRLRQKSLVKANIVCVRAAIYNWANFSRVKIKINADPFVPISVLGSKTIKVTSKITQLVKGGIMLQKSYRYS